jgi:endonuclease/exonuclease/phosphatase (EEP) superfamily protein YafD
MKDRLRRWARPVPWAILGIVLLSVILRATIRDAVPLLSTIFYALPPVVGAAALLGASGTWFLLGRRKPAAGVLAGVLLLGAWQVGISAFRNVPAPGDLKLLLWNVKDGSRGWDRLGPEIAARDADLVLLVETGARMPSAEVPGLAWVGSAQAKLSVGVRGEVRETELVPLADGSRAFLARVVVRERPLTLLLVDLAADPLRSRREAFERLDALRARVKPDLVAGDFNTPRDSALFDPWRRDLRHAFEAAGDGFDLTWPAPLPVLSIDHAWAGPRLLPRSCRHESSWSSDHRAVVAEFQWAAP